MAASVIGASSEFATKPRISGAYIAPDRKPRAMGMFAPFIPPTKITGIIVGDTMSGIVERAETQGFIVRDQTKTMNEEGDAISLATAYTEVPASDTKRAIVMGWQ